MSLILLGTFQVHCWDVHEGFVRPLRLAASSRKSNAVTCMYQLLILYNNKEIKQFTKHLAQIYKKIYFSIYINQCVMDAILPCHTSTVGRHNPSGFFLLQKHELCEVCQRFPQYEYNWPLESSIVSQP